MFSLFRCLPGILIYAAALGAVRAGPADPVSAGGYFAAPEAAVALALHDSPGLAALRARAEALAAVPSQAGALPDPMIGLNAMSFPVDSFDRSKEPMTQLQLEVRQDLPFPGKRGLMERAAAFEAEASAQSVDEAQLQLRGDVQAAWWRLFYLDRALELVDRNLDLLRQLVDIAQTRYKVGEGLQQDVLLAQVERSQLADSRLQLTGERRGEVARFNALLGRDAAAPVTLPTATNANIALPEPRPLATLLEAADAARPRLTERRTQLQAADARVELARRERLPDFSLGAAYGFRDGRDPDGSARDDLASLSLSMRVPLYADRKQNRAVDQRNSERLQQRYEFEQVRDQVHAEVAAALADYDQAREQARLFDAGIIPQARQTVASMRAGYQVNKVDFLNLVRAQITLYNHETRYWQALSDAHRALARLNAAVGREVFDE